ncbi:MAG: AmmeMemoRadiSam system radical SAM enzyme [Candidatus Aenigmarchaeota archaeon]|nr:AmmeMemoRadiSam system radical SAM enzyme [Candidatus Aenigmarchaeota archaeon]MBU5689071.1 AmmeMemoRadiSam system radical SAM enzyme [Candidatus Aenigmarchaeota archaeon]
MKLALMQKQLKNKLVKCTACSQYCIIQPNSTGLCGIRKNVNGKLYLLVYGKAAAVNIDPVEKKPLYHFLPGSKIFSFGTLGCDFGCLFCQNWDISQPTREIRFEKNRDELLKEMIDRCDNLSPKQIVDYCLKYKLPSIAYTYNEPAVFFEYAYDTAKLAKKYGIKNVFVSNGYESKESLNKIKKYLDAANIDLKSFSEEFYLKICKAKLEPVLKNIENFYNLGIWIEVTTLIIPGKNDSEKELKQIAEFIASISKGIPWHVTAFHPDYKMFDAKPTQISTLIKAYKIGKNAGLKYVYIGNVAAGKYENTFCPNCGNECISRIGFFNIKNNLEKGKCKKCGYILEGVWE